MLPTKSPFYIQPADISSYAPREIVDSRPHLHQLDRVLGNYVNLEIRLKAHTFGA